MKEQRGAQYIGKNRSDYKDNSLPDVTRTQDKQSVTLKNGVKRRRNAKCTR